MIPRPYSVGDVARWFGVPANMLRTKEQQIRRSRIRRMHTLYRHRTKGRR